jgi:hypothetical protein
MNHPNLCTFFRHALLALLLAIVVGQTVAEAQSGNATLGGTVTDEKGQLVTNADITISNPATGIQRQTQSDGNGAFVIVQLPPGTYALAVERNGFAPTEIKNIVLQTGDRVALEVKLQIGKIGDTVSVTADSAQLVIKSESGERSEVVNNRQLNQIALNGRNIFDLMKTIPGVTPSNQTGEFTSFVINGTRPTTKEITIDGSSNVVTGANQRGMVQINPDAVEEVKVLTSNYQAEYGRAGGGFIQFTTRSGTSQFHGGARYFRRHDSMNANNYFSNARRLTRPLFRFNNYGYDLGGPVTLPKSLFGPLAYNEGKNKLFFFWNQEWLRQRQPTAVNTIRTPTAAERNGDFSATTDGNGNRVFIKDPLKTGTCAAANTIANPGACFVNNGQLHVIPGNRFFKDGQAVLNIFPQPNDTVGGARYNYSSQGSNNGPQRQDILRVDWNLSDKTRFTGRYAFSGGMTEQPFGGGNNIVWNFPLATLLTKPAGRNAVFTLVHTFSPTLTNEFIIGPSINKAGGNFVADDALLRSRYGLSFPLLLPNAEAETYLPTLSFGGIANQNFPAISGLFPLPGQTDSRTTNYIDNLTKVTGRHTLKFGFYLQDSLFVFKPSLRSTGDIAFTNDVNNPLNTGHPFANALLGIYTTYQQASGNPIGRFRYRNYEWYAQDTWRVNNRLTLDYGLRMALLPPQYDERLQTSVFDPTRFDRAKAVRLYTPVLVGAARRAVDPALLTGNFTPTTANTLPTAFIGLIVPNSGDPFNGLRRARDGAPRGGFDSRGVQWGPRLGFALDLFGDKKTVVRGGYGISYDRIQGNIVISQFTQPPNVLNPRLLYGNLADLRSTSGLLAPSGVTGYAPDGKIPNIHSFSLGVQRNIGWETVLDVAYVGTLSRHLVQQRDLNAIPFFTTFQAAAQDRSQYPNNLVPTVEPGLPAIYQQAGYSFSGARALPIDFLRAFPGYTGVNYREFTGSANYHSLQVGLNRRFTRHLTFGVAYTWSKVFETGDADFEGNNPFNVRGYDYRLASFDRTHVLVANYVWDLPKVSRAFKNNFVVKAILNDWQVAGISVFSSGEPLELSIGIQGINTGQRVLGTYSIAPRFFLNGNPGQAANGLYVDPAAFVLPKLGDVGPYPRTYLRGPGTHNHDLALYKNIPFDGERKRYLQLRFELFNAFNHTQFSSVNLGTQLVNSTGQIGNAVFNGYPNLGITNNLRSACVTAAGQPDCQSLPLGQYFGEYNGARSPRVIQLAAKFYF